MARIDYLKEKADRYKILFRFMLNVLLTIVVGFSGLLYSMVTKIIDGHMFWILAAPILILFVKGAIMTLTIWSNLIEIDREMIKEK